MTAQKHSADGRLTSGDCPEVPSLDVLLDFEKALLWEVCRRVQERRGWESGSSFEISLQFGNCVHKKEGAEVWPVLGIVDSRCLKPDLQWYDVEYAFGIQTKVKLDGRVVSDFTQARIQAKHVSKVDDVVLKPTRIFGLALLSEAAEFGSVSQEAVLGKLWSEAAARKLVLLDDRVAFFKFSSPEKLVLEWGLRGGK